MKCSFISKLFFHSVLYFSMFSCARKNFTYTPPVYDASGIATVTDPYVGGGKYEPPAHSILEFKTGDKAQRAESYQFYGNFLRGEKFRIRYNSQKPSEYDIRFDEPVFSSDEEIVKSEGGIISVKTRDTSISIGNMSFVFEIITNKRDSSGSYYMSFGEKFQYIKRSGQEKAKPGYKYVVYYQKDRPERAILYTDSIIDSDHAKENYFYYKAEDKMLSERYKRVIELLSRTLEIDPVNEYALYARGKAYYQLDKYNKAEKDFTSYISKHPDTYDGYLYRAMIAVKRGTYTEALTDLDKAVNINPDSDPDLYNFRGMVYSYMDNYENAIDNFTKAIQMNPNAGKYYYNRAAANVRKSRNSNAGNDDYREAKRLGFQESQNVLNTSNANKHDILADDIKQPWSGSYISLTSETGFMPCRINATSASISFPYDLQNQSTGAVDSENFQRTINFPGRKKAVFTTFSFEAGNPTGGYFITRIAPVWSEKAYFWDIGGGLNIPVKNERVMILRPELTISYFEAGHQLGEIYYGHDNLSVLGYTSKSRNKDSYANVKQLNVVWSLKPKLGVWLFPKNLISIKVNGGYQLPFGEIGKNRINYVYDPHSKYGSTGYKKFNPIASNSGNTPLYKLYSINGLFASVEFVIRIP